MASTETTDERPPLTTRDKLRRTAIVLTVLVGLGGIAWGASHAVRVDNDGDVVVDGVDPDSVTISGDPDLVAEQPPGVANQGPPESEIVEETIPTQGAETLRQAQIGIDLGNLYNAKTLSINGTVIPEDELTRRPELNQVFFQPADGETFETLPEGHVCVTAAVERLTDPGDIVRSVEWCFEVT
jgi:hypothetical protein